MATATMGVDAKTFRHVIAAANAIPASFATRNKNWPIYAKGKAGLIERGPLKSDIQKWLVKFVKRYGESDFQIESEQLIGEIVLFAKQFTQNYRAVLHEGRMRVGVSQKCINLYLKYLWLMGAFRDSPPHCPIDGFVLQELSDIDLSRPSGKKKRVLKSWTELDREDDYRDYLAAISAAKRQNESIAEWELRVWNERQTAYMGTREAVRSN